MQRIFIFMFAMVIAILTQSCGNKSDPTGSTDTSTDEATQILQSAAQTVGEALQGSTSATIMTDSPADDPSLFAACSAIGFGSCASGLTTRDFGTSGCKMAMAADATRYVTQYGSITLAWNPTTSCGTVAGSSSGSVTRYLTGRYATVTHPLAIANGASIYFYTSADSINGKSFSGSDLMDFNGISHTGGTTITFNSSTDRAITINGIHRRGYRPSGLPWFWHTIYTSSDLLVIKGASTYTIASGTVNVAHNLAQLLVSNTFDNVAYPTDGSCCFPTSGTITTTIGTTATTFTFSSTCGSVSINGSTSATQLTCGGTGS